MTITETDSRIDEDTIETIDFEYAVPCDGAFEEVDCPNEAKFSCHMVCCGERLLLCEDCMLWLMNLAKKAKQLKRCMRCMSCDTHSHVNGFETLKFDGPI